MEPLPRGSVAKEEHISIPLNQISTVQYRQDGTPYYLVNTEQFKTQLHNQVMQSETFQSVGATKMGTQQKNIPTGTLSSPTRFTPLDAMGLSYSPIQTTATTAVSFSPAAHSSNLPSFPSRAQVTVSAAPRLRTISELKEMEKSELMTRYLKGEITFSRLHELLQQGGEVSSSDEEVDYEMQLSSCDSQPEEEDRGRSIEESIQSLLEKSKISTAKSPSSRAKKQNLEVSKSKEPVVMHEERDEPKSHSSSEELDSDDAEWLPDNDDDNGNEDEDEEIDDKSKKYYSRNSRKQNGKMVGFGTIGDKGLGRRKRERQRISHRAFGGSASGLRPAKQLPQELQAVLGQAHVCLSKGDYESAKSFVDEVIRQKPDFPDGYRILQRLYEETNDEERAWPARVLAAQLDPRTSDHEWAHIAEIHYDHNMKQEAAKFYKMAMNANPSEFSHYERQIEIFEEIGVDKKRIHKVYVSALKNVPDTFPLDAYVKVARSVIQATFQDDNIELCKSALKSLLERYTKESETSFSDLNSYCDLLFSDKLYEVAIKAIVEYGQMKLCFEGTILNLNEQFPPPSITEISTVPDFPLELKVKFCVCWILLDRMNLATPMLQEINDTCSVHEDGDLLFEIAEAYADVNVFSEADEILCKLLNQQQHQDKTAIWVRHAEVSRALGNIDIALNAWKTVCTLAPENTDARLNLSALQQQLGRPDEALASLSDQPSSSMSGLAAKFQSDTTDERLLYQQCALLLSQNDEDRYVETAISLMLPYFAKGYKNDKIALVLIIRTPLFEEVKGTTLERRVKYVQAMNKTVSLTNRELTEVFYKIAEVLYKLERRVELLHLMCFALMSPIFLKSDFEPKLFSMITWISIKTGRHFIAWQIVKGLIDKVGFTVNVCNILGLLFTKSQEVRYHKYILRAAIRSPDNIMLSFLNGNNSFLNAEYLIAYKCGMKDNFVLMYMLAATFAGITSKKSVLNRHSSLMQGLFFLKRYWEVRGDCQEVFYNLGRFFHQLGIYFAAIHFYNLTLDSPASIDANKEGFDNIFDLRSYAAYNLAHMAKSSGNHALARQYISKYLVI